jgi:hypothetical protein
VPSAQDDRAADFLHESGEIELDREKLDADLREALRERCLPEYVETEFTRVMDAVFRVSGGGGRAGRGTASGGPHGATWDNPAFERKAAPASV